MMPCYQAQRNFLDEARHHIGQEGAKESEGRNERISGNKGGKGTDAFPFSHLEFPLMIKPLLYREVINTGLLCKVKVKVFLK